MKTKKFKLEKEFAKKWLEALRSGKYEQGEGYLQNADGQYCCLGVACRVNHPRVKLIHKFFIDSEGEGRGYITKDLEEKMPKLLRGTDGTNEFVKLVSEMNDEGQSFHQIADWIEKNVKFV